MDQWQTHALTPQTPQSILGVFGDLSSYSVAYNLYADRLLGTSLVPQYVRGADDYSTARS